MIDLLVSVVNILMTFLRWSDECRKNEEFAKTHPAPNELNAGNEKSSLSVSIRTLSSRPESPNMNYKEPKLSGFKLHTQRCPGSASVSPP